VECTVRLHPNGFSQISEREAHAVNYHAIATEVETSAIVSSPLHRPTHSHLVIRRVDDVGITSACRSDETSEAADFCDALVGRYRSSDAMKLLQSTHIHAQQTPDGGVFLPHSWRCTFPNYHGTLGSSLYCSVLRDVLGWPTQQDGDTIHDLAPARKCRRTFHHAHAVPPSSGR
jgi:hypothetical protein